MVANIYVDKSLMLFLQLGSEIKSALNSATLATPKKMFKRKPRRFEPDVR